MNDSIVITPYNHGYAKVITELYHAAVHAIDSSVYSEAQKAAWAPTPPDYGYWTTRLAHKRPFVAVVGERVAGFMELEADGHIDCAYTHPDFQRCGVATALYHHLEQQARKARIPRLFVEASLIARPLFKRWGFELLRENQVPRGGEPLINFSMEKHLRVFSN